MWRPDQAELVGVAQPDRARLIGSALALRAAFEAPGLVPGSMISQRSGLVSATIRGSGQRSAKSCPRQSGSAVTWGC